MRILEREPLPRLGWLDFDRHAAFPGETRLLLDANFAAGQLDVGRAGDEQIHEQLIVARAVGVAGHGRNQPANVGRAARAGEPLAAGVVAAGGERIRVEKLLALQRHAGQHVVVERSLQHVDVLGVAVQQEHAVGPEAEGDAGARFAVGRDVRQLVVLAERLALAGRADAAREVQLFADDVVPQPVDRVDERLRRP